MRSVPKFGESYIVNLEDMQEEEEERGTEGVIEQDLEEESNELLQSWDRPLPKSALQFHRNPDVNPSVYYDGETGFDELKKNMQALSDRVFIKITESNPDGTEINAKSTIVFDRIGFLEYNPIPIESSIQDGKPSVLSLAEGPILPGLLQGLLGVRQGERANILIHPALAYGPLGAPPLIPRDSYLFYNVKVYQVMKESDLDAAFRFEKENFEIIPISEKMKIIREHKDLANQYLRDNQPREALIRYKAAIKWAQEEDDIVKDTDREWRDLLDVLYQNAAITYNKLDMPKSASKAAKSALSINPENVKAYFQLSKARLAVGDNSGALRSVERAHQLDKDNQGINNLRLQIDSIFREEKRERDEIFKKMSRAYI